MANGKWAYEYVHIAQVLDEYGFQANNGGSRGYNYFNVSSLDLRRSSVPLEFEILDPKAPPNADGRFEEVVEFKNVPLPLKRDKILRIGRTLLTKQGTRVYLQAIAVASRHKGYQIFGITDRVLMSIRTLPPVKTPDMTADVRVDYRNGFRGVNGEKLVKDYGNGWTGEDLLGNRDTATQDAQTLFLDALPSIKARSANIRIAVSETAASLKQKKWFRRVRFQLPQNQLSLGAIKSSRPVSIADAGDVAVTLSFFTKIDAYDYRAGILLANKNGANWKWKIESATLNDVNGQSSIDFGESGLMWSKNGRPVQAGEENIHLDFDSLRVPGTTIPTPLSEIRLNLKAEKRQPRVVNFRNLPIPRGRQSLSVSRTVKFASGAWFTIRKIESGTFDNAQQRIQSNEQPTKIAITFDSNSQADSESWVEYEKSVGVDNLGHDLRTKDTTRASQTLYFVPPPLKSKSFDLRLLLAEVTRGPRKTVIFHSLPTPTTKPKAK